VTRDRQVQRSCPAHILLHRSDILESRSRCL